MGEMKRMFSGKGFWAAVLLGALGIALGASYPKLENALLPPWSFLELERTALYSQVACFLIPVAAVLPWSDSFLSEWKGGFLKSSLPRMGRLAYVKSKVLTVAFSGFLAWMAAGIVVLFGYFVVFFPMEQKGTFPVEAMTALLLTLLRVGIVGGILSSLGGLFGVLSGSVYLAYGLPFVAYYFCMILHDRYFSSALWVYPPQWIEGSAQWGEGQRGLWLFLLTFLLVAMGVHGGVLYGKLEEI